MCDTLYKSFSVQEHVFAKNSDRDPEEPQVLELARPSLPDRHTYLFPQKDAYIKQNLQTLEKAFFDLSPSYQAIISRPTWIWGAEMGVNERGVSIGNEAVFSFARLNPQGLLGMDILRLALHSAASAKEAVEIITYLIQHFGQGGNCAFRGTLTYHNSFLVSDSRQAFVIETAGKKYAARQLQDFYSISNIYTIGNDYDHSNLEKRVNFRRRYQASVYNIFTQGNVRRNFTMQELKTLAEPMHIRNILRSHIKSTEPRHSMASVCMHSPRLIKSETTASMIVHYKEEQMLLWATASPTPCVSLYKPLTFSFARRSALVKAPKNLEFFSQRRLATRRILSYPGLMEQFHKWQAEYEASCYRQLENFAHMDDGQLTSIIDGCWDREQQIIDTVLAK